MCTNDTLPCLFGGHTLDFLNFNITSVHSIPSPQSHADYTNAPPHQQPVSIDTYAMTHYPCPGQVGAKRGGGYGTTRVWYGGDDKEVSDAVLELDLLFQNYVIGSMGTRHYERCLLYCPSLSSIYDICNLQVHFRTCDQEDET